jgi:MFS family permease
MRRSYPHLLAVACGVGFAAYVASFIRLPVLPLYARSLGIGTTEIGWVNASFYLLAGGLSVPLGSVSDRLGRKVVACAGLALLAGASFGLCLSTRLFHFIGSYLLLGAGVAAFTPTMMSYVADLAPPNHLGRAYGWYTTGLYVGMSAGPALGGWLAREYGFRAAFAAAALVLSGVLAGALRVFPADRAPALAPGATSATDLLARRLWSNRPLLGNWLATLGGCFGLGMFITFMPLHAQNRGLDVAVVGLVFLAQGLANAVSRIPFGQWSDRVRQRKLLVVVGLGGFAVSLLGFGAARSPTQFLLSAVGFGACMGLAFTSVGALIAECVPARQRGAAMGGYNTCIFLGMLLNSLVIGAVAERFGFAVGFGVSAAVILLCAGMFFQLMREFRPAAGG